MATKSFNSITTLSVIVTFMAVVLGFIGVVISEMYPGFIILFLMMLRLPLAQSFTLRKTVTGPITFREIITHSSQSLIYS